ncbi:MAG: hypothetical protein CSA62_04200 [Planctomycetota bacterium]|nr:MAG: hypothetical protein CSA62_04200 [Planctomycetota bacterium]
MLGFSELAKKELAEGHPALASLQQVEYSAERAASLTRQMLEYSGNWHFELRPISLQATVARIEPLLVSSIPSTIELCMKLEGSPAAFLGDAAQIQHVLVNLVTNASEAIGEQRGRIAVSTSLCTLSEQELEGNLVHYEHPEEAPKSGSYILLEVEDDGCGMDADTQARAFEPFFTTKFTGRGLGLAAVQGVLRGHSAALLVRTAPNEGTCFRVFFPHSCSLLPNRVRGAESKLEQNAEPASKPMVLVVDDEAALRSMIEQTLDRVGYEYLSAVDGEEAVELARKHHDEIACVLLDLVMPRLSGYECFVALREILPRTPILLMSGYAEREVERRFSGLSYARILSKPFFGEEMVSAVSEAIAEHKRDPES